MQTAAFYTAPVGYLRYYTSDFMVACFVDMMNGSVNTVQPCSSTMNRWSQNTQQQPPAVLYMVVLLDLKNNGNVIAQAPQSLPCNGHFDIDIL